MHAAFEASKKVGFNNKGKNKVWTRPGYEDNTSAKQNSYVKPKEVNITSMTTRAIKAQLLKMKGQLNGQKHKAMFTIEEESSPLDGNAVSDKEIDECIQLCNELDEFNLNDSEEEHEIV
jgi:hypothetical protein